MKKLLLLIVATLIVLVANSQNYRFFDNDYMLYRDCNYYPYQTLNIDTVGSIYHYKFQTMLNYATNPMYYDVNGPGFIGQYAEWDTIQNIYYLHNIYNDTITIYTNRPNGFSWLAYEKDTTSVIATITNVEYEVYNDSLLDTIKTISFDCQGVIQSYSFDDEVFKISSRRGLIQVSNIIHFPYFMDYGFKTVFYKEDDSVKIQMFNPNIIDNISEAKIYDLHIDDELHIKEQYLAGEEYEWDSYKVYKIMKVLERIEYEDVNTILYLRKYKRWKNGDVDIQKWDTISLNHSNSPLEGIIRYDGDGGGCVIYNLEYEHNRIKIIDPNAFYYKINDSIWEQFHGDKSPGSSYGYVGLGDDYYYGAGVFNDDYRSLVYYNVSGDEWGTPLNFTVGIESINVQKLQLYPNPTNGKLIIEGAEVKPGGQLLISDLSGKLIINQHIQQMNDKIEIDVSELNTGLYTIQLVSGKDVFTSKFIKVD